MISTPPNILFITADNQPATLLGCHGNTDVETPHIDRMAAEGTRFTRAFSTNGMCSPGRASLFTGLMPSQHGVHSWLNDDSMADWPAGWCAVREFRTLPATLAHRGYQTALIGKYHMGRPDAPMPGFERWLAFALGHTHDFYDNRVIDESGEYAVTGRHIVDFFTDKAVDYLTEVDASRPFFLNVNYDAPYLLPPTNYGPDPRNRFYERYAGRDFPSFPREAIHPNLLERITDPELPEKGRAMSRALVLMHNDPATMANVCAQVSLVDESVGRLLALLDERGLSDNTLVVFTADQANLYGQHGLWGHTINTHPSHLYDAGLHIPLIVRRPGHVPAGRTSDLLVGQCDLAPTLMEYLSFEDAEFAGSPGRSLAPVLAGGPVDDVPDAVFFEQEETRGIRTDRYSYWKRLPGFGPPVLFDLEEDPGQRMDVAASPAYADVVAGLDRRLTEFFARHADPRYDLWNGGRAKGSVLRPQHYRDLYGPEWGPIASVEPTFSE
ncbi:sulfatase-like hydrolase/transferase [Streptomyces sp. NPDC047315]|uniref:sulfatase-like hydrolase/transferase n=1 Tax=Streptomyces sp. NPDC047315 TaxID=3155142 RepID=UPI0033DBB3B6